MTNKRQYLCDLQVGTCFLVDRLKTGYYGIVLDSFSRRSYTYVVVQWSHGAVNNIIDSDFMVSVVDQVRFVSIDDVPSV